MPKLILDEQSAHPRIFEITRDHTTIGRYEYCDIVLDTTSVSRQHARIHRRNDGYYVEDLNSINGTYVNRHRVEQLTRLHDGDELHFYKVHATFRAEIDAVATATAPVEEPSTVPSPHSSVHRLQRATPAVSISSNHASEKLKAVLRVVQAIGTALDIETVLLRILDGLFAVFTQARRGNFWLIDAETGKLVLKASKQMGSQTICSDSFGPVNLNITDEVLATKSSVLRVEELDEEFLDSVFDLPLRSVMCVPLLGSDQSPLGVIYIDSDEPERQFDQEDLDILTAVSSVAAQALELARGHERTLQDAVLLEAEKQRRRAAEQQLKDAQSIQQKLYPARNPDFPGFQIAGVSLPADSTCGDYFDFLPFLDGSLGVVVGDVCGHGLGPALYMVETRACLRTMAGFPEADLSEMLQRANSLLWKDDDDGIFVTMFLGRLRPDSRTFSYLGAGHEALLIRANGSVGSLDPVNVPLGMFSQAVWAPVTEIALNPGDVILIATDGFQEAGAPKQPIFGQQRIVDLLLSHREATAQELLERLCEAIDDYTRGEPRADDRTAIVIRAMA